MKFSKTINFEAPAAPAKPSGDRRANLRDQLRLQPPLDGKSGPKLGGQAGLFSPIRNDFSLCADDDDDDDDPNLRPGLGQFQESPEWSANERDTVRRVRFVVCSLALSGLAFALMSRLILNVSIVEMVKARPALAEPQPADELASPADLGPLAASTSSPSLVELLDELQTQRPDADWDALTGPTSAPATSPTGDDSLDTPQPPAYINPEDDGLRFDWSKRQVNMILGSFYVGYMPGILLSGGIAQRYGAKFPLLVCVLGTAITNMLTPTIARLSLELLIGSRILLGLLQGSLFPAMYELFNWWLTQTESSIFVPMIKVSIPLGSVIGTLMPGLLASLGLQWPYLFYIGGVLCLAWSVVWFYFATSRPQANRFVSESELKRIMRKKRLGQQQVSTVVVMNGGSEAGCGNKTRDAKRIPRPTESKSSTPWRLIMLNPSVLALTVVKFTYNIGIDFIYLELAVYLREAHSATIETISLIASSCYIMQMFLITFVAWLAKEAVRRRAFNFSVTKWRKTFQGSSNFCMALVYVVLALLNPGLELASLLIVLVCFFWMLGAGGESMVPYDLSSKYPASIVGFAHSVSILSGVSVPFVFDLVLGEETKDPERWRLLFLLVGGALAIGGLVFVLVLKAKPFLPEEKNPPAAASK